MHIADRLDTYIEACVNNLGTVREKVVVAFRLISEQGSPKAPTRAIQLLALRRYLRAGLADVETNWSWTNEEAKRKETEEPGKTLYAEAEKVRVAFAKANPGYTLILSPIRSLEKQVKLWNENGTTHRAAIGLLATMEKELKKESYVDIPTGTTSATFRTALYNAVLVEEPTNAAPGTSDHGRGVAVDFVVMRGRTPVASIKREEVATRWKHDGWEARLIAACKGTRLRGPLQKPYEPWHWILE